jgi:hypothetical protein
MLMQASTRQYRLLAVVQGQMHTRLTTTNPTDRPQSEPSPSSALVARLPKWWTGEPGIQVRNSEDGSSSSSRVPATATSEVWWVVHAWKLPALNRYPDRCLCLLSIFCTQYTCLDQPQLCSFSDVVVNGWVLSCSPNCLSEGRVVHAFSD